MWLMNGTRMSGYSVRGCAAGALVKFQVGARIAPAHILDPTFLVDEGAAVGSEGSGASAVGARFEKARRKSLDGTLANEPARPPVLDDLGDAAASERDNRALHRERFED